MLVLDFDSLWATSELSCVIVVTASVKLLLKQLTLAKRNGFTDN